MSKKDYDLSKQIVESEDYPFNALIMAAARRACPEKRDKLREVFPEIVVEYNQRFYSPGGRLPGDRD